MTLTNLNKHPFICRAGICAIAMIVSKLGGNNIALAQDEYATAKELGLMEGFPPPSKRH